MKIIKYILQKISAFQATDLVHYMACLALLNISSCTTVKEYQKNKLNDSEMVLSGRPIEKTELNFQSYREGASGVSGGKTGGGCGCN